MRRLAPRARATSGGAVLLAVLAGCRARQPLPEPVLPPIRPAAEEPAREAAAPRLPPPAATSAIVVAGERVPVDCPVVLWTEPPRYDAASPRPRFSDDGPRGSRFRPVRRSLPAGDVSREALARAVDLFVLHYDVCGTSATTFRVLHDQRQLSVHFLLDVDGTVYQTLDLAAEAWHARQANPRSIGVEIAQIGAYPPAGSGLPEPLARWYGKDAGGTRITIPPEYGDGGVRTRGFVGRPARSGLQRGTVNGETLVQYDFTTEQYRSLVALTAALVRAFPKIELDAPRGPDGRVLARALTDAELARFHGIVGHWHVSSDKLDPGPAFDWERFLAAVRARVAADAGA